MNHLLAKLRGLLLLAALALLLIGLIRVSGKISSGDVLFLAGGGLLLGLGLRSIGGTKPPAPPARPIPKSGA